VISSSSFSKATSTGMSSCLLKTAAQSSRLAAKDGLAAPADTLYLLTKGERIGYEGYVPYRQGE
jgi:hypothetical protein